MKHITMLIIGCLLISVSGCSSWASCNTCGSGCDGASCYYDRSGYCGSPGCPSPYVSECQCTDPSCYNNWDDYCISTAKCCHAFGNIGSR